MIKAFLAFLLSLIGVSSNSIAPANQPQLTPSPMVIESLSPSKSPALNNRSGKTINSVSNTAITRSPALDPTSPKPTPTPTPVARDVVDPIAIPDVINKHTIAPCPSGSIYLPVEGKDGAIRCLAPLE